MKRMMIAVIVALGILFSAAFSAELVRVETQSTILSSTPAFTALRMEIPAAQVLNRLDNLFDGERSDEGIGELIAIAGTGTPVLRVRDYQLGEVVASGRLDNEQSAASLADFVTMSEPVVIHDLRIVKLNVNPVVRDARGDVRVVTAVELEIETSGSGGVNTIAEPTSFSFAFYPIYRHLIRNLDDAYPNIAVDGPGRILYLMKNDLLTVLGPAQPWQTYLDWKVRKGWTVQVVGLTDLSESGIRNTISAAYHDAGQPRLDYAVIVGDHDGAYGVSTISHPNPENNEPGFGDNDYYTVEGNDQLPDVLHGRIAAQSPTEVIAFVNKVIRYEADPERNSMQWFHSGTFMAGNFSDGSGTYPVTPVWNMEWARQRLLQSGCLNDADTCYYHSPLDPPPSWCTQTMINDINAGVCVVMYRGWADSQCWQYPIFCINHVDQLHVGKKNPAVFATVCGSGKFTEPICLGEKWTTGIGSPSTSNGAIAFYGASDLHTNTRHNNAMLAGITEALLIDGLRSMGEITYSGELEGWRQYPRERDGGINALAYYYIWHVFNILGDPEVPLTICEPRDFNIWTPENVGMGETLLPVSVTSAGLPVQGAVVTVRGAGMNSVVTRLTDEYGLCYLPLNFNETGTAQMTIWRAGYFLVDRALPVIAYAFDPHVAGATFSDGNDNQLNPGEEVSGTLQIRNAGSEASAYSGTLTSLDARLLVLSSGEFTVPSTAPGATQNSSSVTFRCADGVPEGDHLMVRALITNGTWSAQRDFYLEMYAGDPQIVSVVVNDGNNGFLDPGETASLDVTVRNAGRQAAGSLHAQLSSFDNAISFPDRDTGWPALGIGEQAVNNDQIRVTAAAGVTPGRQVNLRFVFNQGGTTTVLKNYLLTVGQVSINAPTGPDAYGYYAYENIDAGFSKTPTYNWIELIGDPNATLVGMRDDSANVIDLPAPFRYYGVEHTRAWICSNGWISFGRATIPEFRNWEFPSPIGPPYMICPFFDDLVGDFTWPNDDTLHYVYTKYDAGASRFTFEWSCYNRRGFLSETPGFQNVAPEKFEVILEYDSEGDDDILFQYHTVNNMDQTNNYATVGIQDSLHENGLNLTFSNFYPLSVDTLRNGRAIRLSTTPPDNFLGADEPGALSPTQFVLKEAYPNPFNPTTEIGFELAERGAVSLRIYDMLGREVTTLVDEVRSAGSYTVMFDGSALSTGLYFARLEQGTNSMVRKLMLVK